MLGFHLSFLLLLTKSGLIEMAIVATPLASPSETPLAAPLGTPLLAPSASPLSAPLATGAPSSYTCTPDQCCSCTSCAIGSHRSLQAAKKMCNCEAVCYYFNGGGQDLDLSQTGLVQDVTDRWQKQELTNIQNYICGGGAAGKTWSIARPPFSCDWWIGGFTLTLKNVVQVEPCKYQATLTMYDLFQKPLDINSWICWTGELPFGMIFAVKYTWTIDIICPGCEPSKPSKPAPKPAPVAPVPSPANPAPKPSAPFPKPLVPAPTPTAPLSKPRAPVPTPRAPVPQPVVPAPQPSAPLPKPILAPVPKPSAPVPKLVPPVPKPSVSIPKPVVTLLAPKPSISKPIPVLTPPAPKPSVSKPIPVLKPAPKPSVSRPIPVLTPPAPKPNVSKPILVLTQPAPKPSVSVPKLVITPTIVSAPLGTNSSKT